MIDNQNISLVAVEYVKHRSLGLQSNVDFAEGTCVLGAGALEIEIDAETEEELRTWGVSNLSLGGKDHEGLTILIGPARLMNVSTIRLLA